MYILSIDTTAKVAAACISSFDEGELFPLTRRTLNCGYTHSETLLPMVDGVLKDARLTLNDISLLAISAGPGSFTGVRIGVSLIKGISFGMSKLNISHSCIPVSSLEALAYNVVSASGYIICPVMDARRSQFYNALFKVNSKGELKRLCPDRLPTASELYSELSEKYRGKKILLVGDGAILCKKLFDEMNDGSFKYALSDVSLMYQDAFSVARAAVSHPEVYCDGRALSPIYLRASQAERERLEKERSQA